MSKWQVGSWAQEKPPNSETAIAKFSALLPLHVGFFFSKQFSVILKDRKGGKFRKMNVKI